MNIKHRSTAAFTIIEVLVTISLIVILTAILIPAFGHAREQAKKARWFSYSSKMRAATDLLAYYAFDGEGEGNVIENRAASQTFNKGAEIDPRHFDLTLMKSMDSGGIAYEPEEANELWKDARWSGKKGIEFNNGTDKTDWAESRPHLGTVIGGKDFSVFVSFVGMTSVGSTINSGLLSVSDRDDDVGSNENPWYLSINNVGKENARFLFFKDEKPADAIYVSDQFNYQSYFSHIIMSFSGDDRKVTWYRNGEKFGEQSTAIEQFEFAQLYLPLVMGANFNIPSTDQSFFKGVIDEAAIFLRALDEEDAKQIAENGDVYEGD